MMAAISEYAFSLLRTESPLLGSMRVRDSDLMLPSGTVIHGIDADGMLHLLVPLAPSEKPQADQRSPGVQLVPVALAAGSRSKRYLDVVCHLPHLNPLFCQLADEMLEEMRSDPSQAAYFCQVVLDRWRELIERRKSRLLGPEQLMGLAGELLVLEQLATRNPSLALTLWTGPMRHRFDFVSGANGLEVKTSTSREGRSVEIHGDRQLEAFSGGALHLVYYRLEPRVGSGETVPSIINRLIAGGISRLAFLEALERVGYFQSDQSVYDRFGFDVLEQLVFVVDDDFPRIIPSSFKGGATPAGVSSVRYSIDLSGPTPSPLGSAGVVSLFDNFIAGS